MLVEVIVKELPYVGKRGDVRDIPDNEAEVHILLGNVKKYVRRPVYEPASVPVAPRRPRKKKKRTYKRRDIVAEGTEFVGPVAEDETDDSA
jgi:hypothetical protein